MVNQILLLLLMFNFCGAKRNKTVCEIVTDSELHCSTKEHDKIVVHLKAEEVVVQCPENLSEFITLTFPKINIYIEKVRIQFCPWPNKPFHTILNGINFAQLKYFEFSVSTDSKISLESSYFEQLQNVTNLKLSDVELNSFDSNFLRLFPHLSILDFNSDNIILKEKVFEQTDTLTALDLSRNGLKTLPNGVFRRLNRLKTLHLWGNFLESLNKSTFEGLEELKFLELSSNKIKTIDDFAFKHLKELKEISLVGNKIKTLPQNLFKHNKKLETVYLSYNSDLKPSNDLFTNLSITKVSLKKCGLKHLSPIFRNSTFLRVINLKSNKLRKITMLLFSGLVNLETLYLDHNQLRAFTNEFKGLSKLKLLSLKNNLIEYLDAAVFTDLKSLEKINLEGNKLTIVSSRMFANNINLKIVNLSNNSLADSVQEIFLQGPSNLTKVNLQHNRISKIKLTNFYSKNNLFIIKLDYNNIRSVDFKNFKTPKGFQKFSLNHNNLQCDCFNYDLVNFLEQKNKTNINIIVQNFTCEKNTLTCPLEQVSSDYKNCPEKCACFWKTHNKAIIIDCSNQNLNQFPKIDLGDISIPYNRVEINLKNNNLAIINNTDLCLKNEVIIRLLLSHNKIREVKSLPEKLEVLELDHNELTNLQEEIFSTLKKANISRLTLSKNPWICDCSSNMLLNLLKNSSFFIDRDSVICKNTNELLINLDENSLCSQMNISDFILILLIPFPVISICLILVWQFQESIKIFLFNANFCFCWDRKDFDKDKLYDAFISYSRRDEEFVVNELVKVLEKPPLNYKLCVKFRDWNPGEIISTEIIKSIQDSHRTLIVLSENYLECDWAKEEFKMAHSLLINEDKSRLIPILYGEIDIKNSDPEIFMYLKTNTYLKWTDSLFWSKLKYVLPHRKHVAHMINFDEDSRFLEPD